jgi:LytS/YehU family sensor histidine kinase
VDVVGWSCASVLGRFAKMAVPAGCVGKEFGFAARGRLCDYAAASDSTLFHGEGHGTGLGWNGQGWLHAAGFLLPATFGLDLLIYGLLWTACGVISMQMAAQRDAMRALELRQELSAAHLRALQMQLEPHFLFNTLNAITGLVDLGRNEEASETLGHLNRILKATLSRVRPEKVSLATELDIIENYLAIEQVRFADRLRVEIRVDLGTLDGLVPCFLLQPIVENAIRHGIAQREEDGMIVTSIERQEDRLHLRVRDNGPGLNGHRQAGHGIGLKNTEERLSHFYASRYDMKMGEPETGGFEVAISIPYECAAR